MDLMWIKSFWVPQSYHCSKDVVRKVPHWQAPKALDPNREGTCLLDKCIPGSEGSLEHILLRCQALSMTRFKLMSLAGRVSVEHHQLSFIISQFFNSDSQDALMQLLLDCSTIPIVIQSTLLYGPFIRDRLHYLGRTWCYNIHRERMNLLGLLEFRWFLTNVHYVIK